MDKQETNRQTNELIKFGMNSIGQILVGAITAIVEYKVITWLEKNEKDKRVIGFQPPRRK